MTSIHTLPTRPDLYEWNPLEDDIFYTFNESTGIVSALYNKYAGIDENSTINTFCIKKPHYKKKMSDILLYTNYFTSFYDLDRKVFFSVLAVKYAVDTQPEMTQKEFTKKVIEMIVTDSFIMKCKLMAKNLYSLDIDGGNADKYKSSPKITNDQARQIVATSFAFRLLIPICIHYTNVNYTIDTACKTAYLDIFFEIYNITINKFQENDVKFVTSLKEFVYYRTQRLSKNNRTIFDQKKMLYGDTLETMTEQHIEEVIIVKTLYKLDYRKSAVSFIDGVISRSCTNYLREKYPAKPYMIDSAETSKESDSMSHAEALEMAAYNRDESSIMVDDVNRKYVIPRIRRRYEALGLEQEELDFYNDKCKISEVTSFLVRNFYADIFKDSYAVDGIGRKNYIEIMIYMKKFFFINNMPLLGHITTSIIEGKYKESNIKNSRAIEEMVSSNIWKDIIYPKFKYILEIDPKNNPIFSTLTGLLNAEFFLIEYNSEIDGTNILSIDEEQLKNEYLRFLSII